MNKRQKKKMMKKYRELLQSYLKEALVQKTLSRNEIMEEIRKFMPEPDFKVWADKDDPMKIHFEIPLERRVLISGKV